MRASNKLVDKLRIEIEVDELTVDGMAINFKSKVKDIKQHPDNGKNDFYAQLIYLECDQGQPHVLDTEGGIYLDGERYQLWESI